MYYVILRVKDKDYVEDVARFISYSEAMDYCSTYNKEHTEFFCSVENFPVNEANK